MAQRCLSYAKYCGVASREEKIPLMLQGSGKQPHQSSQQNVHTVPLAIQLCFHCVGESLENESTSFSSALKPTEKNGKLISVS
jgi:hypothetical protein